MTMMGPRMRSRTGPSTPMPCPPSTCRQCAPPSSLMTSGQPLTGLSVCFRAPGAMGLLIALSSPRRKYPSPSSPTSSGPDSWRWVKYGPWGVRRFAPACVGSPCPSLPSGAGAPSLRLFTIPSSSSRWFPRCPIPPASSAAVAFRVTHTGWSSTTSPGSTSFPYWAWAATMSCAPPCLSGGTMRNMSYFVWSDSPWVPRSLAGSPTRPHGRSWSPSYGWMGCSLPPWSTTSSSAPTSRTVSWRPCGFT
mmetsp:Transcript_66584/g.111359  ORF Transcript_66584/g.111359 Transcript_66584/m.111359 type:complete len:248 (-) Transcript_66584:922-1665(-)